MTMVMSTSAWIEPLCCEVEPRIQRSSDSQIDAFQMYHVLWFGAAFTQTKFRNSHVAIHLPTDLLGTV